MSNAYMQDKDQIFRVSGMLESVLITLLETRKVINSIEDSIIQNHLKKLMVDSLIEFTQTGDYKW